MNYCMNKNLWLLLDSKDPADELLWLIFELQLAELKGEKVSGYRTLNCTNLVAGAHLGPHPTWPRGLRAGVERQLQRHRRPLLARHRRPVLRPHSP